MWPDEDPEMSEAEFRESQRKRLPPDDEMPRVVGLNAALVYTAEMAVTLTHCVVYSRGLSFRLTALFPVDGEAAESYDGEDAITAAIMPIPGRPAPDFVLSLVLADDTS